jgi:hypothetical protein
VELSEYSNDHEREYITYETLEYRIHHNVSGIKYYVNLPILLNNHTAAQIINEIKVIQGNASFKVEQEWKGTTLNVSSTENDIILMAQIEKKSNIISPSEEYGYYKWSTDPRKELRSTFIYVRVGSDATDKMNTIVNITFFAKSNVGTAYGGQRRSNFDGVVDWNNYWVKIYGRDEAELA